MALRGVVPRTASKLATSDAAYLAGLLDADGHIGLYIKQRPQGGRYVVQIGVVNSFKPVLEWIAEATGIGSVQAQHKGNDRRKPTFYWLATGEGAISVLEQVVRFMRVKPERAMLAIEVQKKFRAPALREDRVWQEEARLQMAAMNKRGPEA